MKKRLANPWLWAALVAVPLAASSGGCYSRVVGAEGVGTSNYTIHEANLKEEKGIFGFGASKPKSDKIASPTYRK